MNINDAGKKVQKLLIDSGVEVQEIEKAYPLEKIKSDLDIGLSNGYSYEEQIGMMKLLAATL